MPRLALSACCMLVAGCAGNTPITVFDQRAEALLDTDARFEVHGEGYAWTEGPLWIEEGGFLLFSDIPNNVIYRLTPGLGIERYLDDSGGVATGQGSNGLLLDPEGALVLFQQGSRRVARMDAPVDRPVSRFETLADRYQGRRFNSPNDGVYDRGGRLYFTDPPYGLAGTFDDPDREIDFQGVYRLDSNGSLHLLDADISAPNGIAISGDGRVLYVAVSDPESPRWLAYDLAADGSVGRRRLFYDASESAKDYQGLPDGMAVHSSGWIFATGPGGVWLFTAVGEPLALLETGKLTANCTLSADEKTLYVTAHDTLLSIPLR